MKNICAGTGLSDKYNSKNSGQLQVLLI